jgi:hypothetical protein
MKEIGVLMQRLTRENASLIKARWERLIFCCSCVLCYMLLASWQLWLSLAMHGVTSLMIVTQRTVQHAALKDAQTCPASRSSMPHASAGLLTHCFIHLLLLHRPAGTLLLPNVQVWLMS